jgi:hypothetical protein
VKSSSLQKRANQKKRGLIPIEMAKARIKRKLIIVLDLLRKRLRI